MWLYKLNAKVSGFSLNPPSNPYNYEVLGLKSKITDIRGDIKNYRDLYHTVKKINPEIIIHLAAQPILLKSYDSPIETYETNTIGTLNLLEACRKVDNLKAVLIITTDKVYKNAGFKKRYREEDALGGFDPYSASKAAAEIIVQSYSNSFFKDQKVGIATARAGNIIGGGDWGPNRIVTDIVKAYKNKSILNLRHPDAVRPWTFILDIIYGYLKLMINLYNNPERYSGPWNFGPNYTKTVEDLVIEFQKYLDIRYVKTQEVKMHEDKYLLLDSRKSKINLKWKPLYNFSKMVNETASWYLNFYNNRKKMFNFSLEQIENFRGN